MLKSLKVRKDKVKTMANRDGFSWKRLLGVTKAKQN
jgi:hypothetical protein